MEDDKTLLRLLIQNGLADGYLKQGKINEIIYYYFVTTDIKETKEKKPDE